MAEVHIVDIDGEQWNIKDLPLSEKVDLLGGELKIKAIGESYKNPKNNIFRGKCLNGDVNIQYPILPFNNSQTLRGGGYSIAQIIERIANGSFDDIYIGDYIIGQNNRVYRLAGFDTELNKGDNPLSIHHAVIVTDFGLTAIGWNTTDTTVGGYKASAVQSYCDKDGQAAIESVFGKLHVLTVQDVLSTEVNISAASSGYSAWKGVASSWGWSPHKVRLMSEIEVFGARVWSSGYDIGTANEQFPLFRLMPQLATGLRYDYWLSGIANANSACIVGNNGLASHATTSTALRVRVRFIIG